METAGPDNPLPAHDRPSILPPISQLEPLDVAALNAAVEQLEAPGFFMRVMTALGTPMQRGIDNFPVKAREMIARATTKTLSFALDSAVTTMDVGMRSPARNRWHKLIVGATGAAGGAFGLAGLSVELPLSTGIMLRSIADIARAEGEDLRSVETRLQCVSVLGMGGRNAGDRRSETAYYASRIALGKAISEAAAHGGKAVARPAITRLLAGLAERLAPQVADKVVASAIPILGAAGGSAINLLFIDHFQSVAHGHFTVRRLERQYGPDLVKREYEKLARALESRRTHSPRHAPASEAFHPQA